jgi:hypothetical protein
VSDYQEDELQAVRDWFRELGFELRVVRAEDGVYSASLDVNPDGTAFAPDYGLGNSATAAAVRAKTRYESEQ